jgi:hypothetical protein
MEQMIGASCVEKLDTLLQTARSVLSVVHLRTKKKKKKKEKEKM